MRRFAVFAFVMALTLWAAARFDIAAASDGDQYVGAWKGSWARAVARPAASI